MRIILAGGSEMYWLTFYGENALKLFVYLLLLFSCPKNKLKGFGTKKRNRKLRSIGCDVKGMRLSPLELPRAFFLTVENL